MERLSVLTSLRAPDDCPGKVLNCSLGGRWRQVVVPIYYQPQVFKVHPIEKGPGKKDARSEPKNLCLHNPLHINRQILCRTSHTNSYPSVELTRQKAPCEMAYSSYQTTPGHQTPQACRLFIPVLHKRQLREITRATQE